MSEGNRAKTLSAPAVAVLAVDTDFHENIPDPLPFRPELRETFVDDAENRERLARFSGALRAGCFILAVRAAGLAARPMLGFGAPGVDAEFFGDRLSSSTSESRESIRGSTGCRGSHTKTTSNTDSGTSPLAQPKNVSRVRAVSVVGSGRVGVGAAIAP